MKNCDAAPQFSIVLRTQQVMKLTDRVLDGMIYALSVVAAGGPEDLTGYDDDESQELHQAACDAKQWALGLKEKRQAVRQRRQLGARS